MFPPHIIISGKTVYRKLRITELLACPHSESGQFYGSSGMDQLIEQHLLLREPRAEKLVFHCMFSQQV